VSYSEVLGLYEPQGKNIERAQSTSGPSKSVRMRSVGYFHSNFNQNCEFHFFASSFIFRPKQICSVPKHHWYVNLNSYSESLVLQCNACYISGMYATDACNWIAVYKLQKQHRKCFVSQNCNI